MVNIENSRIIEEDYSERDVPSSPMPRLEEYKASEEDSSSEENIINIEESSFFHLPTPSFEVEDSFEMTINNLDKIDVRSSLSLLYLSQKIREKYIPKYEIPCYF